MGSEMCIRDSSHASTSSRAASPPRRARRSSARMPAGRRPSTSCSRVLWKRPYGRAKQPPPRDLDGVRVDSGSASAWAVRYRYSAPGLLCLVWWMVRYALGSITSIDESLCVSLMSQRRRGNIAWGFARFSRRTVRGLRDSSQRPSRSTAKRHTVHTLHTDTRPHTSTHARPWQTRTRARARAHTQPKGHV